MLSRLAGKRGTHTAKEAAVINPTVTSASIEQTAIAFWKRIINGGALQNCNDLEKLVVGCELIAVLDDIDLLAPA